MTDKYFIDSNIWLYTPIEGDHKKTHIARKIIALRPTVISTQVINEVSINLRKKCGYTEQEIRHFITHVSNICKVHCLTSETCLRASSLREEHQFSFWDSLIVVSAIENNCNILYSEDMHHEMRVQNTLILNPFYGEIH